MPLKNLRTRQPHEVIAQLRKYRGLTLVTAAAQLGMSKSELARIEGGQRRVSRRHVALLARLYAVDFTELLGLLQVEPAAAPVAGAGSAAMAGLTSVVLSPEAEVFVLTEDGALPKGSTAVAEPARALRPGACFLPREGPCRLYRLCVDQDGHGYGLSLCGKWRLEAPQPAEVLRVVAILPG